MRATFRTLLAQGNNTLKNQVMDREKLLQNPLPMDRVAARVVRGKGEHWEAARCSQVAERPMKAPPASLPRRPREAPDLTGVRRDRLVLVAYAGSSNNGAKWLARCDCGNFLFRKAAKFERGRREGIPDACAECIERNRARRGLLPIPASTT